MKSRRLKEALGEEAHLLRGRRAPQPRPRYARAPAVGGEEEARVTASTSKAVSWRCWMAMGERDSAGSDARSSIARRSAAVRRRSDVPMTMRRMMRSAATVP